MTTKKKDSNFLRTFLRVKNLKMIFTKPLIHKTFILNKKGKKVPGIVKKKYWYVYYFYRNPVNGEMTEFREQFGLNKITTITNRTLAAKILCKEIYIWLQEGNSPFKCITEDLITKKEFTAKEAIELAVEQKTKVWAKTTAAINVYPIKVFVRFLEENNLYHKDINEVTKRHIILFLNNLGVAKKKPVNATTRNTYRKVISAIFNQMVADEIILKNFVEGIPKLKEKPTKNTPFTKKEMEVIKAYLLKHDPYLYLFIKFIMYAFFRPVEICRIQLKDINKDRNTISVISKTEDEIANVVYITTQINETIKEMTTNVTDLNFYLFTKDKKPSIWNVDDTRKRTHFGNRFLKVKNALGFSEKYGLYSFRHSAAISLFTTYKKQNLTDLEAKTKMLPITRHKTIDSLDKYLRDIGASVAKDYSNDFDLDF